MGENKLINFFDFRISTSLEIDSTRSGLVYNTINPHSFIISKKDELFKKALISCDFLVPDGVGIVWGIKVLNGKSIDKISGFDLFVKMMSEANQEGKKCFFLGSSQEVLEKIKIKCSLEFPNISFGCMSPPFRPAFTNEDNCEMRNAINNFRPDFLFIGMTAPKQEKWLFENRNKLIFGAAASIGAVFDFYAGTVKRPSQFWINLGLEWLPRFMKEPKRLWKRNLVSTPLYVWDIFKEKLKSI
ncbi:WecB/TagA/CpsF family glycosyltransferase [Algoriphagus namhaensis]|uniref:WecB/TagA/CpsF family glycosyltransferase n=1 Tax=Algoriphagus namhaensis TaxID=915353 RepID=A0ABV8ASE6_9BACT